MSKNKETNENKASETPEKAPETTAAIITKPESYVIGCKLPNGLSFQHEGTKVVLNGANSSLLINGFGITRDVPADAWESFKKAFKDQKIMLNGIVFAVTDYASAEDAAAERANQKTGLEQVNPKKAGVEDHVED